MRIRVVGRKGNQEILTIVGPLTVVESPHGIGMSHFTDTTGTDHYFMDSDGTYDGWGRAINPPVEIAIEKAMEIPVAIDAQRERVEPILPTEDR